MTRIGGSGLRVESAPLIFQPISGLREGCARRPSDDQGEFASGNASRFADLLRGQVNNALLDHDEVRVIRPQARSRIALELDRRTDVEPGGCRTEIQSTHTREEANRRVGTHPARVTAPACQLIRHVGAGPTGSGDGALMSRRDACTLATNR